MKMLSKSREGLRLKLSWLSIGLLLVLLLTALNGYFDSAQIEYGASHYWEFTFLGEPADRDADLLKSALSLADVPPSNMALWDIHYRLFYTQNAYGKLDDVSKGIVTAFNVTPFMLIMWTGVLHFLYSINPATLADVFDLVSLVALGLACWWFIPNRWEATFAFCVLALGYPFAMVITRGNIGALVVACALVICLRQVCERRGLVLAVLCFAIACNVRPNAIVFAPLFLAYGWRRAILASLLFLVLGGVIALCSYFIVVHLYPGYSWSVFLQALHNYHQLYIIGTAGDANNNSAYGAFKTIYQFLPINVTESFLVLTNQAIAVVCGILLLCAVYRFWRGWLPIHHFAFVVTALYVLASTIFATYHLIVFYFFFLAAGTTSTGARSMPLFLLFAAALVIIPKNYGFAFPNISWEVIINPVILFACVLGLLWWRYPATSTSAVAPSPVAASPK